MIPKLSAAILALCAFSGMLIAGMLAGNPFTTILSRALWGLAGGFCAGYVLGLCSQAVVHEHFGEKVAADVESEIAAEADDWSVGDEQADSDEESPSVSENPSGSDGVDKEAGESGRELPMRSPDTTFAARAAKAALKEG